MKKIKAIIFIAIVFFASKSYSQTTSAPAGNNAALKEAALKANQKKQERKNQSTSNATQSSSKQAAANSFQLNEDDQYQGRKDEFLSQLIIKEIPTDFPKYEKWMGVRHYNEIIEEYYKKHLDIVTEIVKSKLLRK
jgi:hypothetical protein